VYIPEAEHCRYQFGSVTRMDRRCKSSESECTEALAKELIPKSDLEKIYQEKCEGRLCPMDENGCRLICKVEIDELTYTAETGMPSWCLDPTLPSSRIPECIAWANAEEVCAQRKMILCRVYAKFDWRCVCK
jgi:hypothetical protein